MTEEQIKALGTGALKAIIASTNPTGCYANEVRWAKAELCRREVDYTDCLEPGELR